MPGVAQAESGKENLFPFPGLGQASKGCQGRSKKFLVEAAHMAGMEDLVSSKQGAGPHSHREMQEGLQTEPGVVKALQESCRRPGGARGLP